MTHIIIPDDKSSIEISENFISMDIDEIKNNFKWLNIISADIRSSDNVAAHDGKNSKIILNIINAS